MSPQPCPDRAAAFERGDRFYCTGRPCRRGHIARRRTDTAVCVECHRENSLRQYLAIKADPEKWAARRERLRQYGK